MARIKPYGLTMLLSDKFALFCICLARKYTTWGFTDDHLAQAEKGQRWRLLDRKASIRS